MKFRHGAWLWADNTEPHIMRRMHEYRIEGSKVWLACVDRESNQGADSFEGTILELQITSPMVDVIRVQVTHHAPLRKGVRGFDLDYAMAAADVKVEDRPDEIVFTSGKVSLHLGKKSGKCDLWKWEESGAK